MVKNRVFGEKTQNIYRGPQNYADAAAKISETEVPRNYAGAPRKPRNGGGAGAGGGPRKPRRKAPGSPGEAPGPGPESTEPQSSQSPLKAPEGPGRHQSPPAPGGPWEPLEALGSTREAPGAPGGPGEVFFLIRKQLRNSQFPARAAPAALAAPGRPPGGPRKAPGRPQEPSGSFPIDFNSGGRLENPRPPRPAPTRCKPGPRKLYRFLRGVAQRAARVRK